MSTQINALASHPTMPLLVTGHEDKYIRIFDISAGKPLFGEDSRVSVFTQELQVNARIRCWPTSMV